jgi:hypothetical protein
MSIAYITKDATKEEIYDAYIKAQNALKMERHYKKSIQNKVKEVRKEKNKKYNELRYQLLKKDQLAYKLNIHIANLQKYVVKERTIAKKKGIEQGRSRVRTKDYAIIKMHNFLMQIEQVSTILGMKLPNCAFILWAGRYDFFTIKDYNKDMPNSTKSFHSFVSKFKNDNLVVGINNQGGIMQYSLTGTGLDMFNKINKFTKKHFNG